MKRKIAYIFYTILITSLCHAIPTFAQSGDNPPPMPSEGPQGPNGDGKLKGPRPMPKEAIEACNGKTIGETCSFKGRKNDNVEGTCRTPPQTEGQVVCVPKPPQQAFDACKGKSEGDTCTFTGRENRTVNGMCKKSPMGDEEMVCRPQRPMLPGQEGRAKPNNPPMQ